jgi:hypothetical protein
MEHMDGPARLSLVVLALTQVLKEITAALLVEALSSKPIFTFATSFLI